MNDYIHYRALDEAVQYVIDNATKIVACTVDVLSGGYPLYSLVVTEALTAFTAVSSADFTSDVADGASALIIQPRTYTPTATGDLGCVCIVDDSVTGSEVVLALFVTNVETVTSGTDFYVPSFRMPFTPVEVVE